MQIDRGFDYQKGGQNMGKYLGNKDVCILKIKAIKKC